MLLIISHCDSTFVLLRLGRGRCTSSKKFFTMKKQPVQVELNFFTAAQHREMGVKEEIEKSVDIEGGD